jgi:hypothetical protein
VSRLSALLLALAACGPTPGDTGDPTTASTDETGDGTTGDPTTGAVPPMFTPDQQFCIDRCKHLQDDGCPYFDESCYSDCLASLDVLAADPCGAERRASWTCEIEHPLDDICEAPECADVYLQEDLCTGYCWHLGGYPGGGASTDECYWSFDGCYGHDLEMACGLGDDPQCTCRIDGADVGTCSLGIKLSAFNCPEEEFHIFSGCCTEMFLEVIQ